MNYKIAIIIPYYGKWPSYFKLFLESTKNVPELDILIFSDLEYYHVLPENVKIQPLTINEFRELASTKIGFNLKIENFYKLCEFKPAYGLIFEDYIASYDFWGFGDIDLIYGTMKSFVTHDFLKRYDIISTRKEYLSGAFCLFKNSSNIKRLFLESKDVNHIFSSNEFFSFAECNFNWQKLTIPGNTVFNINNDIEHMTLLVQRAMTEGRLKALFKSVIKESINSGEFLFIDSKVKSSSGEEYLLYHFITEKRKPYFKYPDWDRFPDKFYIDNSGFYLSEEFKYRKLIRLKRKLVSIPIFAKQYAYRFWRKVT